MPARGEVSKDKNPGSRERHGPPKCELEAASASYVCGGPLFFTRVSIVVIRASYWGENTAT